MRIKTLQRLGEMAPGEKMTAYTGNFEYDIARCDRQSPADKGAPTYKAMLEHLHSELLSMVVTKRIRMEKIENKKQRTSNRGTVNDWRDFSYEVTKLIQ